MANEDKTKEQLLEEMAALRRRNAELEQRLASTRPPPLEAALRFRLQLLDSVEQAVIATDLAGRVIFWNRFAEQLYGWTAAEAEGKTTLELIATEDSLAYGQEIMAHLQQGEIWAGEYLAQHKDGTQFLIHTTISPVYDSFQKLAAFVAVSSHHTTDRQQAEQTLRQSEERFRLTLKNSKITVWHQDKDLHYTWIYNPTSGFEPEEIIGQTDQDLLPRATANHLARIKQRVLETGRAASEEVLAVVQGQRFYYDLSVEPLRQGSGEIEGITCIAVDITERKKAERKQIEAEYRFRTSVETMIDAFGIYSALRDDTGQIIDFRVDYVNQAACEINRYTKEEQIGQKLLDLLPAHRETGLFDEYCRLVETGQPIIKEALEYEDDFNQKRLKKAFDIRAAKLGDGFAVSWRDVTERRQAEQALRESKARLQEANAAKDKFFSIIAHDLKNPFVAVLGGTEMLEEHFADSDDQFARKVSVELHKSARRLFRLLDNLLTWSRMQDGKIPYKPVTLDVNAPAARALALLQETAAQKQISVVDLIEEVRVQADYNMVETIFRNLISNAIKFTPAGGQVTLSAADRGDFIEISVTDNGVGMAQPKIERLFKAGERKISTSGTAGETGTGLGLILCQEFVKKHGGKIWAESREDQGSSISFTLPRSKGDC